uniref:ESPR domain-containing protein n=1 Tax=Escherichia coli TaxID=562 RepID=UPI0024143903
MNKAYNTVWSASRGMWVVTSELPHKGRLPRKIKQTSLAGLVAGLLLPSMPALAKNYDNEILGTDEKYSTRFLNDGDVATNTTINSGGVQNVSSGGSA